MSRALLPCCHHHLLLLLRAHGLRWLSSHVSGAERCRGHPQQHQQRQQEESKAVKVSVWWDFQRCQLPPGANPCRVAPRVTAALRAAGIRGPVEITAFGDVYVLPRAVQEALAATGVAISHVPSSGKDGSDRSFMANLVYWIAQNPPPAHFFLISGDKDFVNILHRLRMSNYNILLACPNTDPSVLCSAATIMWPWEPLVKGVGFLPKHFNQPPDGLSCSWYGHYKGALDDPFLKTESKGSMALPLHTKKPEEPPIIPNSVVNGVREALNSYPEGINLQDLQSELKRNSLFMDKGLFGFKSFTALLRALPDVVKFVDSLPGDSQPAVVGACKRSEELAHQSFKGMNSAQSNGEVQRLNEKPPSSNVPPSPSDILSTDRKKNPEHDALCSPSDSSSRDQRKASPVDFITQSKPPACHMEADVVTTAGSPSLGAQGLFERFQILWNGPKPIKPEVYPSHGAACSKVSNDVTSQEEHNTDQHNRRLKTILKNFSKTDNPDGKDLVSNSAVSTSLSNTLSSNRSELNVKENFANTKNQSNKTIDISKAEKIHGFGENNKGILSWAARWWSSGKSDTRDNRNYTDIINGTRKDSDKGSAFVNTADSASGQHVGVELFEKSYFWDALEQYLSTPHGSRLVSEAKTREELAHGLQKQGCWSLKGLDEKYLHQLVHLLVSEKKWIKESPSETFYFLLTLPQRTYAPLHSSKSDGLSSFFTDGRPLEQCKSVDDRSTAPSRKSFQILPARNGKGQASYKGNGNQTNGDDFAWEELGPVSSTGDPHQEIDKGVSYHPPTLSDDEFSDDENHAAGQLAGKSPDDELSDDENHAAGQQAGKGPDDELPDEENHAAGQQARSDAAQSSLLKIIASWNTSRDGGSSKSASRNTGKDDGPSKKYHGVDRLVDLSRTDGRYRQRWRPTAKHRS